MDSDSEASQIINAFHNLFYNGLPGEGHLFQRTQWMGVPCLKCPLDLWVYQEILHEIRPDLVVETGTHLGGSALFMAHILDLLGKGEIFTIDINAAVRPPHPRIRYVLGSSADEALVGDLFRDRPCEVRMVVLDSDHAEAHVSRELELLSPWVSVGSYLIVEDTNINGHPTYPAFGPGPFEAVATFLEKHPDFVVDLSREKFLMTFNPRGFLKRIR
jgi:cephalosporin hydroxylase